MIGFHTGYVMTLLNLTCIPRTSAYSASMKLAVFDGDTSPKSNCRLRIRGGISLIFQSPGIRLKFGVHLPSTMSSRRRSRATNNFSTFGSNSVTKSYRNLFASLVNIAAYSVSNRRGAPSIAICNRFSLIILILKIFDSAQFSMLTARLFNCDCNFEFQTKHQQ